MDSRSAFLRTHGDRHRLSASLPQQSSHRESWSQPSSSRQAVHATAFLPSPGRFRPTDPTLDESTLARRTAAFRQLNGTPRPLSSRRHRREPSTTNRSSTLATQPVLVRAYSEDEQAGQSSTMPLPPRDVQLPSVQDFSIEGILRAIEPEIRSTLDSIAEICGRSKLSLANEYGSHIAPFGEIVAPPTGLLPVEEASASAERVADDNVIIADDDHSVLDGRDIYAASNYGGLLENLRQTAYATGYQPVAQASNGEGLAIQGQPESSRNAAIIHSTFENDTNSRFNTATKEFAAAPKPGSRALLGNAHQFSNNETHSKISTPPVLSETYLEARANESSWPTVPPDSPRVPPLSHGSKYSGTVRNLGQSSRIDQLSLVADVQRWLGWLKGVINREDTRNIYQPLQSAETTLRTVLDRHKAYLFHGRND